MTPQPTLPFDQPRARPTDPETSHAAASSVGNLTESRAAVLRVMKLQRTGLIDEELASIYAMYVRLGEAPEQSESGLRTRRCELVRAGLLKDTGERRANEAGRSCVVWGVA